MKGQNDPIFYEKLAIKQLTHEAEIELMKDSVLASSGVLNQGLKLRILQAIKLIPNSTKLVVYHTEKKQTIGFLCLEENTNWLYSIKYVFIDPKYRRRGVATKLLSYAMTLAKEKGAKKVNLNVYLIDTKTIELYKRLGFREISPNLLGQGVLSGFKPVKMFKRVSVGLGSLINQIIIKKGRLFRFQTKSKENRKTLFSIYQRCMDQNWIDFFEINPDNLLNGSRNVWRPPFFRTVLINDLANSFALIFSRPWFDRATVELYTTSKSSIPSLLEDLLKILIGRGISFVQITIFNPSDNFALNWFEERDMKTFQFISMGKDLLS